MGRPAYQIESKADSITTHKWVEGQLRKASWLEYDEEGQFDFEHRYAAEQTFKKLDYANAEQLQAWCETWLRTEDWTRLKTTIRAKRHNAEKSKDKKNINVDYNAWIKLSALADAWDCTLSEAIDKLATPAYQALP